MRMQDKRKHLLAFLKKHYPHCDDTQLSILVSQKRKQTLSIDSHRIMQTVNPERQAHLIERGAVQARQPNRWLRRLVALTAVAAAMVGVGYYIDSNGWAFFNSGKDSAATLRRMAVALQALDFQTLENLYSPSFAGSSLGLTAMQTRRVVDGVTHISFQQSDGKAAKNEAVKEWRDYAAQFQSIEEVGLHIHRIESWGSTVKAVVRFELIGTLQNSKQAGIDRAFFQFTFSNPGYQILSASLVEGERIINANPQFQEVGAAAGIAFRNRYYPPFLTQPLKFGMIRYGPGGITAVDYDNDGFYDLFIPDGVESKLFRNLGNGTFKAPISNSKLSSTYELDIADVNGDGRLDVVQAGATTTPNGRRTWATGALS